MQSSGASLFAMFLAQRPDTVAIIDLWDGFLAPDLSDCKRDVVLKCVIAPVIPLDSHLASFKPDFKILFVRSKESNLKSLSTKNYRNDSGKMGDKFAELDLLLKAPNELFDFVIHYEDFLKDRSKVLAALGELASPEYFEFKRTKYDILDFNRTHSAWCRKYYRRRWSFGNIHFDKDGKVLSGKRKRKQGLIQRLLDGFRGTNRRDNSRTVD
jgi:hypothetical protein